MNRQQLIGTIELYARKNNFTNDQYSTLLDIAGERIKRRFPNADITRLREPTDQNNVSIYHPMLYVYGVLRELNLTIYDGEQGVDYNDLWKMEADKMDITYKGDDWVSPTVCVLSEAEQEVASGT